MDELRELIDKYWAKKLTLDEKVKLSEMISGDTAHLQEGLEDEYYQNLAMISGDVTEPRFLNILQKVQLRIENAEQSTKPKVITLYRKLQWAAALLIMTLGAGIYAYKQDRPVKIITASYSKAKQTRILKQVFNQGKEASTVKLSDGSVVTLQPGSSLSYYQPFVSSTRSISMQGEVSFKVAKDKLHPFIVTARGFTTTALGTYFIINTKNSHRVLVKLMEGKVVIKTTSASGMDMKDVYLTPGQQLAINTVSKLPTVSTFTTKKDNVISKPVVPLPQPPPFIFKEDTLSNVFDQLAARFKIRIDYEGISPEEVAKLFFTGTFEGTESLDAILPAICNMNELNYKRTSNSIIISKQK